MKVIIERVPRKEQLSFWRGERDHPTEKAVHVSIQLTEEEKEILKRSDIVKQGFHLLDGRAIAIHWLFEQPYFEIEPFKQDESHLMYLEQDLEKAVRTVKAHIEKIQGHPQKRELDL